ISIFFVTASRNIRFLPAYAAINMSSANSGRFPRSLSAIPGSVSSLRRAGSAVLSPCEARVRIACLPSAVERSSPFNAAGGVFWGVLFDTAFPPLATVMPVVAGVEHGRGSHHVGQFVQRGHQRIELAQ